MMGYGKYFHYGLKHGSSTISTMAEDRSIHLDALAEETVPVGKCCNQSPTVLGQPQIENPINNAGLG